MDEHSSEQPVKPGSGDRDLRAKAGRRSWLCPGAGFALLGRRGLALATYLASLGVLCAIAWLVLQPGAVALWTVLGGMGLSLALWIGEQVAVKRLSLRSPGPRLLVGGFLLASAAGWLAAGIALVLLLTHVGTAQLAGDGMAPTLVKGERFLYHKRVEPERLRRGTVVVYRLSHQSAWGQPGALMVSRILAVPGDRLSIQDGKYVINGAVGSVVAPTGRYTPALQVPSAPATLTVPEQCYFVVQDTPEEGLDSRVLSWVEGKDLVGTRLYYVSGRGLLKPVE